MFLWINIASVLSILMTKIWSHFTQYLCRFSGISKRFINYLAPLLMVYLSNASGPIVWRSWWWMEWMLLVFLKDKCGLQLHEGTLKRRCLQTLESCGTEIEINVFFYIIFYHPHPFKHNFLWLSPHYIFYIPQSLLYYCLIFLAIFS